MEKISIPMKIIRSTDKKKNTNLRVWHMVEWRIEGVLRFIEGNVDKNENAA